MAKATKPKKDECYANLGGIRFSPVGYWLYIVACLVIIGSCCFSMWSMIND